MTREFSPGGLTGGPERQRNRLNPTGQIAGWKNILNVLALAYSWRTVPGVYADETDPIDLLEIKPRA